MDTPVTILNDYEKNILLWALEQYRQSMCYTTGYIMYNQSTWDDIDKLIEKLNLQKLPNY